MHLETFLFNLMPTENTEQAIFAEKLLDGLLTKVVRAVALGVLFEITV